MSTYPLPTDHNEAKRLAYQSNTLDQVTWPHIDSIDLTQNATVADIGCGNGMVILHLLENENIGTIWAIDSSMEQLNHARKNVNEWKNKNSNKKCAEVIFAQWDITKEFPPEMTNLMDMIFMRFVLCNINVNYHEQVVSNIKSILKINGKLLCEDAVWDNIYCSACPDIIEQYKTVIYKMQIADGYNRNIGKCLESIFSNANFQINYHNIIDRNITPLELRTMYISLMKIFREQLANNNKYSESEKVNYSMMFDKWDEELIKIDVNDPNICVRTSGTCCVTCTKI